MVGCFEIKENLVENFRNFLQRPEIEHKLIARAKQVGHGLDYEHLLETVRHCK